MKKRSREVRNEWFIEWNEKDGCKIYFKKFMKKVSISVVIIDR